MTAVDDWRTKSNNVHEKVWKDWSLMKCNLLIVFFSGSVYATGFDNSLINALQNMPYWQQQFDYPISSRLGLLFASSNFGAILFSPFIAFAADRFGRKVPLLAGCLCVIIGAFVQAFGGSFASYIIGRIFVGVGQVMSTQPAVMLANEICHPKYRAPSVAVLAANWYLGSVICAWVTYGTLAINSHWQWKIPTIMQCLAVSIQLMFIYWVPQSPRWLISKGRVEEAHKILADYHANGKMDDELVLFEVEQIQASLIEDTKTDKASWKSLIFNPANRKRILIVMSVGCFAQINGNSVTTYYFTPILRSLGITSALHVGLINAGLRIWNWIIAAISAFNTNRFPRRGLWMTSIAGCFACYVIVMAMSAKFALTGISTYGLVVVIFLYGFNGAYDIAFTSLNQLYASEMMTTPLRAKGMAVLQMTTSSFGLCSQYVNPIGLASLAWRFYAVYIVIDVIIFATVYFFYPETQNLSLEEIAVLFDGPLAVNNDTVEAGHIHSREEVEAEKSDVDIGVYPVLSKTK